MLSDLSTIEHILLKQTKNIDRANITINVFKWMTPTGQIALPTNDMWKHHRRIVGPAMTSKYLSLSTPLATRCTDKFVKYIATKAQFTQGRPFEIEEDFRAVTMVSLEADRCIPPATKRSHAYVSGRDLLYCLWTRMGDRRKLRESGESNGQSPSGTRWPSRIQIQPPRFAGISNVPL